MLDRRPQDGGAEHRSQAGQPPQQPVRGSGPLGGGDHRLDDIGRQGSFEDAGQ